MRSVRSVTRQPCVNQIHAFFCLSDFGIPILNPKGAPAMVHSSVHSLHSGVARRGGADRGGGTNLYRGRETASKADPGIFKICVYTAVK